MKLMQCKESIIIKKKVGNISPENNTLKENIEAAKVLVDFAKEALNFGRSGKEVTLADQYSTSEYNKGLLETLNYINKEIDKADETLGKSNLYKQREDILNRMREEKENQRLYNNEREASDRNLATGLVTVVAVVALGAGGVATKILLDSKKS
ncbi:hypothetical protein [Sporosarcina sp. SAFN-010]|uniref:hypothetical protein n=1 Tax=Sporosarcina sp. SAFN-010 TaxID=3387273 RepID=UPI003F7DA8BA